MGLLGDRGELGSIRTLSLSCLSHYCSRPLTQRTATFHGGWWYKSNKNSELPPCVMFCSKPLMQLRVKPTFLMLHTVSSNLLPKLNSFLKEVSDGPTQPQLSSVNEIQTVLNIKKWVFGINQPEGTEQTQETGFEGNVTVWTVLALASSCWKLAIVKTPEILLLMHHWIHQYLVSGSLSLM